MPRLVVTPGAARDLRRCRAFLVSKNAAAANRAGRAIARRLALLETMPDIGRPFPGDPQLRELLVPFGDSGYIVLYTHDAVADVVIVLAVRHQKEAGF